MATFSKEISAGQNISGKFRAVVTAGATITLSVDCKGTITCEDCGISLEADANAETPVISISGTVTETGTFEFSYTGYNNTGPGYISASGFDLVIEPLEVSPLSLSFDKTGGTLALSLAGSIKSVSAAPSASWISCQLNEGVEGFSANVETPVNSYLKRSGFITLTATMEDDSFESATVSVEQTGETFKVVPNAWNVGNGGGARTVSISPDGLTVTADSSSDWANYSNKAVRAQSNPGDTRTATITFTARNPDSVGDTSDYAETATVLITQEAAGTGGTGTGGEDTETGEDTENGGQGNTTPSGTLSDGSGRVGTVIFRNEYGATVHVIVKQAK